jgi:hypothetical protein
MKQEKKRPTAAVGLYHTDVLFFFFLCYIEIAQLETLAARANGKRWIYIVYSLEE